MAAAPAIQNAAEEKSPGTLKSRAWSFVPPRTRIVLPFGFTSMTGGAWKWASRRSVWSREGVFSVMLVVPLAKRPARSRHDFNCALATGSVYSIPVSGPPRDLKRRGVRVALAGRSWRPSWRRGSTMRFIGRLESEGSPTSLLVKGCPRARRPSGAWRCRNCRSRAAPAAAEACLRCRGRRGASWCPPR